MHYLTKMVALSLLLISFNSHTLAEFTPSEVFDHQMVNFNHNLIPQNDFQSMPLIANFKNTDLAAFHQIETKHTAPNKNETSGLTWLFAIVVSLFGIGRGINIGD